MKWVTISMNMLPAFISENMIKKQKESKKDPCEHLENRSQNSFYITPTTRFSFYKHRPSL